MQLVCQWWEVFALLHHRTCVSPVSLGCTRALLCAQGCSNVFCSASHPFRYECRRWWWWQWQRKVNDPK